MKLATALKILCIPEDGIPCDDPELVNRNCSLVLAVHLMETLIDQWLVYFRTLQKKSDIS